MLLTVWCHLVTPPTLLLTSGLRSIQLLVIYTVYIVYIVALNRPYFLSQCHSIPPPTLCINQCLSISLYLYISLYTSCSDLILFSNDLKSCSQLPRHTSLSLGSPRDDAILLNLDLITLHKGPPLRLFSKLWHLLGSGCDVCRGCDVFRDLVVTFVGAVTFVGI